MRLTYRDSACMLSLPLPALPGAHQVDNAALAVAMIQHQQALTIGPMAMTLGLKGARWPARLQRLGPGPLSTLAPDRTLWLDGGHNPDAGEAIARHFAGQRLHLIVGMLANKDPCAIVEPLGERIASLQVVPVPGHEHHDAAAFGPDAKAMPDVASALAALPGDNLPVLICGSLYLAGEVLHLNEELPD
jgi:dihydrofolate synthase/folylpolyglutamate synthase